MSTTTVTETLTERLGRLTLEEKVQLLTGRDFWTTWPLEKIGLRRMLFSDGPSGVRGEAWDERQPSLNLPSATALASSWDPQIAYRFGNVCAVEARRKGVDVVLGPTINLHRSPYGGRHFEAFSEDPHLTAQLAAAYVSGVQDNGVGATPKHFVANDSETDRFTVDVQVSDRALRELYLAAFEQAIVGANAWLVMSAYNSINGATATENALLETPLNSEWGFDGVVISDWTAVRSLNSARHAQDLVMPGPVGPWGGALVAAVQTGQIAEADIDRKVLRLLRLAARVGALDGFEAAQAEPRHVEDGVGFAREAAAAGTVLVRNEGALPWNAATLGSVAVIGHNAVFARTQGGGSATVVPEKIVSPLDGIRRALPDAQVGYSLGAVVQEGVAPLPLERMCNPVTGGFGVRARFLDAEGAELFAEDRQSSALVWFGGDAPITESALLQLQTRYTPDQTGKVLLGFAAVGHARVYVDDELVVDRTLLPEGDDLGAAFLAPPSASAVVAVTVGEPIAVRVEFELGDRVGPLANSLAVTFGLEPDDDNPEALIAEAVEAARAAEVALVVVGTNSRVESEGYDRTTLALPGHQDELVRAVAAVNARTVVVVNSGSPVLLPWREDVSAVLFSYFGGQEFGHALADVLLGVAEPGGRLPTTWPAPEVDLPVADVTPTNGALVYNEGIHIGYRAWLRTDTRPAYPFGHGLGYTTWDTTDATAGDIIAPGGLLNVEVSLVNTGTRPGKQVVQIYAERRDSAVDRPTRWLVGFAPVRAAAGESATVTIPVPARAFAHWDREWQYEPGVYALRVGTSVVDLHHSLNVQLTG